MEKHVGVWIDSEKAYIITLKESQEMVEKIESDVETRVRFKGEGKIAHGLGGQLVNLTKRFTRRKKHQFADYYHKVMENEHLKDADDILIFGPAKAKIGLEKEMHKSNEFKGKVKGVMSADTITHNQMVEKVRQFFEEHEVKKK